MSGEEKIAALEMKVRTLQMYYAAALADSTQHYGKAGILDSITEQKHAERMNTGAVLAESFGVKEPKQAFERIQDTYGCADWVCQNTESGFTAACTKCMLCAFSKKAGSYSPCRIYCLSPIEAMVKALNPELEFVTEKTLWDSDKCEVRVFLK